MLTPTGRIGLGYGFGVEQMYSLKTFYKHISKNSKRLALHENFTNINPLPGSSSSISNLAEAYIHTPASKSINKKL